MSDIENIENKDNITLEVALAEMAVELNKSSETINAILASEDLSEEQKFEQSLEHLMTPITMLYEKFGIIPMINPMEEEEEDLIVNPFDQNNLFIPDNM